MELVLIQVGYLYHVDVKTLAKDLITHRFRGRRVSFLQYSPMPVHQSKPPLNRFGIRPRYSQKLILAFTKKNRYYNYITGEEIKSGTILELPTLSPDPKKLKEQLRNIPTVYTFKTKGYSLDPAGKAWFSWIEALSSTPKR